MSGARARLGHGSSAAALRLLQRTRAAARLACNLARHLSRASSTTLAVLARLSAHPPALDQAARDCAR